MTAAADLATQQDTIIDGYFQPDPDLDLSSVAVRADIPSGESVPMITDGNGNFYSKGMELQFDVSFNNEPVSVTITMPGGWEVVGWSVSSGSDDYQATLPADTIAQAIQFQSATKVGILFKETVTQRLHDPGIRVTPT